MVVMPWALTNQPSLQAGLLCAKLIDAGIDAKTYYANIDFADRIGWDRYSEFCSFHNYCADWLFSEPVFGAFLPRTGKSGTFEAFAAANGICSEEMVRLQALKAEIDGGLDACLERIDWTAVRVVGFTTTMLQPLPALALAKRLAARFPLLAILFGGSGCQGAMGRALHRNFPFVDGVVDGEADATIVPIVRRLLAGESPAGIPGLIWRDAAGAVTSSPPIPVTDLSDYPIPAYDDFFAQSAVACNPDLDNLRLPFEASRGCWWATRHHCRFCGLNGTTLRQRERPLASVVAELHHQREAHGPALFVATDNIIAQRHLRDLPKAVGAAVPPMRLFFEVGPAMSRRLMQGLVTAGVTDVQPGIESLSSQVLRAVDKGTTASLNVCFLRRAQEFGVVAHWNLLYGMPGEDPDWYAEMLSWLPVVHHLPPPELVRFSLQRFSPYFDAPEAFGIQIVGPMPATRYIWDLPDAELCDLAYDLAFTAPGDSAIAGTERALFAAVEAWRNSAATLTVASFPDGRARVTDSRGPSSTEVVLDFGEVKVLAAAEAPITAEQLANTLRRDCPSAYLAAGGRRGVSRIIARLVDAALLLDRDDRLLALPVPTTKFWLEAEHG
ncbi:RiPP maturation radical SAM C-methyltransferase [Bradyrhizobium sp. HKCCYLRH3061]|uniref:RiPP maturation radical SAM C-methyltransferase n=1 Tax=Bradyrhizobium sp. HKCCYLRH3061 TaxID=3420734 RepID=UPI003EBFA162